MALHEKMNWNLSTYQNIETVESRMSCEVIVYNLEGDSVTDFAYSVLIQCETTGNVAEISCSSLKRAMRILNAVNES